MQFFSPFFRMISSCCEKLVDLIIPRPKPPPKHLSGDIIAEILSNLAAEFVHQKCRRVSKEWNSLISSSYFNNMYLKRASTTPRILVHQWSKHKMLLYFIDEWGDMNKKWRKPRIIKQKLCASEINLKRHALLSFSYNGLLVFRTPPQYTTTILINPITQDKIILHNSCLGEICGVFLHPIAREYRVLWLKPKENNHVKYRMLSLGSQSYWRELDDFSYLPRNMSPPVNVNGALHWMSKLHYADDKYWLPPCGILIFSISKENFSLRAHPGDTSKCRANWESHGNTHLLNLEGCLSLSQFSDQKVLEIWILEDYTNWVWTKRYNIKIDLDFLGIERIPALQPLGIQNGALVFHIITKGLLAYHLQTKTTKTFMFKRLKDSICTMACLYTQSLVSLRYFQPGRMIVPCDCDNKIISHTFIPF